MKLYRPVGNKTLIPVGMVIFTYTKTNPSTWFGGTWEQLSGGYLYLCASSSEKTTYTGLNTQSTTLTTNQIPSHTHKILRNNNYTNNFLIDTGNTGQWGSMINQVASGYYTAQTMGILVENTGGGQGHTHNIATVGFFAWRRTA